MALTNWFELKEVVEKRMRKRKAGWQRERRWMDEGNPYH